METIVIDSSYTEKISHLNSVIIKNYLFKLYRTSPDSGIVRVLKVLGISNLGDTYSFASTPDYSYNDSNDQYNFADHFLIFSVDFENGGYEITLKRVITTDHKMRDVEENYISITGTIRECDRPQELFTLINKSAVSNFSFKGKIVKYKRSEDAYFIDHLNIVEPKPTSLDNIFLPNFANEKTAIFQAVFCTLQTQKVCPHSLIDF